MSGSPRRWHIPGKASGVSEDREATRAQPTLGPDIRGRHPDLQRNSIVTSMPGREVGTAISPFYAWGS